MPHLLISSITWRIIEGNGKLNGQQALIEIRAFGKFGGISELRITSWYVQSFEHRASVAKKRDPDLT